jgi:uncharacterized integral membrane protein
MATHSERADQPVGCRPASAQVMKKMWDFVMIFCIILLLLLLLIVVVVRGVAVNAIGVIEVPIGVIGVAISFLIRALPIKWALGCAGSEQPDRPLP